MQHPLYVVFLEVEHRRNHRRSVGNKDVDFTSFSVAETSTDSVESMCLLFDDVTSSTMPSPTG